jgi:hypothetical protein
MDLILRGETVGKDLLTVLYQGSAGIIARTLNGKNDHVLSLLGDVRIPLPRNEDFGSSVKGFKGSRIPGFKSKKSLEPSTPRILDPFLT